MRIDQGQEAGRGRLLAAGCAAVCLALLAAALLFRLPPWALVIDVGSEGDFLSPGQTRHVYNFFGFHQAEQAQDSSGRTFRWTLSQQATVTVPYAQRMQPLVLDVVAYGSTSGGATVPLTLTVNNTPLLRTTATNNWRRYHVLLPDLPHPEYGIMVELQAPLQATETARRVGIAVDTIALRQPAPVPLAGLPGTLFVVGGAAVLAWKRRVLLPPLLLAGCWLLVNALYQPQMLPRWLLTALLAGGLLALWWAWARRWWEMASVALAGIWLALGPQILGLWVLDDAFISFRYARNLVQGHGLVFNPGEYVEGYTNFLWVLLVAAGMAAGFDPLVFTAALNLALAFAIVLLTVALARCLLPAPWASAAAGPLLVSQPFLLYTSQNSGMETGLFAALILAALLALARRAWLLAGLLTALTLMTRPDGVLLASAGGLYALWTGWQAARPRWRQWVMLRPLLWYGGTLAALYLPYFLWRWSYYGYLLPNTFYVKVGSTWAQVARGLGYLGEFAAADPLLVLGVAGGLLGLWGWRGQQGLRWPLLALLAGFVLLFSLYIVVVGGDWMAGWRFFVPLLPLLTILGVWGLAGLARRFPPATPLGGAVLVMVMLLLAARLPDRSAVQDTNRFIRRYREVGRLIKATTAANMWVAVEAAGALPYYAERPTIDMLGLNDEYIAHMELEEGSTAMAGHEKIAPDYVLGRRPEIIPAYTVRPYLAQHELFRQGYREERKFIGPEGSGIRLYVRRDVPPLQP